MNETATAVLPERKAHAAIIPVQNYMAEKEKFFSAHPDLTIIEEIKTLSMGMMEVPDPQLIGRTKPQQVLMIAWVIFFYDNI